MVYSAAPADWTINAVKDGGMLGHSIDINTYQPAFKIFFC